MPKPHRARPSAVSAFLRPDRIDLLLAPFLSDPAERAFVVRCILDEGPAHHRGANYVLLSLLGALLDEPPQPSSDTVQVKLRLPPHLLEDDDEDREFPLRMPVRPLERLAAKGTPEFQAMVDCLTDGPPQHALANAAMVCLLDALLARAERRG